ncbi:MAG: minor capsid protein [Agathobacter rectalis]
MNIKKAFQQFMIDNGYTDVFIGGAPDSPAACWWILGGGGNSISKNTTGQKQKNYLLNIYYRDLNAENVDEKLQALEELMNKNECVDIGDYDIIETEATVFPTDQDIDNQERTIGLIQITLTVYL